MIKHARSLLVLAAASGAVTAAAAAAARPPAHTGGVALVSYRDASFLSLGQSLRQVAHQVAQNTATRG